MAATPASEAENPPPTPTPSTPITPSHPQSFAQKEALQGTANPANNNTAAQQIQPPQQEVISAPSFDPNVQSNPDVSLSERVTLHRESTLTSFPTQGDAFGGTFNDQMQSSDLLDTFDFEEFLDQNAFNMDMLQGDPLLETTQIDTA